jgi:hypothetical protein
MLVRAVLEIPGRAYVLYEYMLEKQMSGAAQCSECSVGRIKRKRKKDTILEKRRRKKLARERYLQLHIP